MLVRLLTVSLFVALVAACGNGGEPEPTEETLQTVVLREWAVTKSLPETEAGELRFRIRNNGSLEHELVIIRTEMNVSQLPVVDSVVDVSAAGELIGEVESIASNDEKSATFNLSAGNYALICNIPAHYEQGMRTDFAVQ